MMLSVLRLVLHQHSLSLRMRVVLIDPWKNTVVGIRDFMDEFPGPFASVDWFIHKGVFVPTQREVFLLLLLLPVLHLVETLDKDWFGGSS
jgi:hypothetical protein